jgi:hypothetical protein
MIDGGAFNGGIEVGVHARVLICVISERLVKICSIQAEGTPRPSIHFGPSLRASGICEVTVIRVREVRGWTAV